MLLMPLTSKNTKASKFAIDYFEIFRFHPVTIGPYNSSKLSSFSQNLLQMHKYGYTKKVWKSEKVFRKCTKIHQHMKGTTSRPNIKNCNHCDENLLTFYKICPEYKLQKEILITAYSNKISFRNA